MSISAEQIKNLREKTGAGIVDCKKALVESGGDLEKAVEVLRKTGAIKAAKKSDRTTAEGRIAIGNAGNRFAMVELNCETDFVAKNPEFQAFADTLPAHLLSHPAADVEAFLQTPYQGHTLQEALQNLILKIGENISVRRFVSWEAKASEKIGSYVHLGNKIAVLLTLQGPVEKIDDSVLRDLAMHVAAAVPQYLEPAQIPQEVFQKEREIYAEQMKESDKPPQVVEKILEGKLGRFADEICLIRQPFVKDPSGKQTVQDYLKAIHPDLKVIAFLRYQVGEGIIKEATDFAAEVAKQLKH